MAVDENLRFAISVAFRMSRDPEVESLAGEAWWRATTTFDPNLGVPLKRYIALCVKRAVWCHWRATKMRKHDETKAMEFWREMEPASDSYVDRELPIPHALWKLLYELHIEKVALDILARERGVSVYCIRRAVAEAERRFFDAIRS